MPIPVPSAPPVSSDYGYTCQCWLKTQIDRECYKPNPWIWFSTTFGAWKNVDSSNPCWLYMELSRAVYQNDVGNRLIKDLKSQMLRTIQNSSLNPVDKHTLNTQVSTAALSEFRAEMWRIDLKSLVNSPLRLPIQTLAAHKSDWRSNATTEVAKNPPQVLQPDEYLIKDLQQSGPTVEYEAIIET
jgi:hypothetical protein